MAMTLTRKRAPLLAGCAMAMAIGTQAGAQNYPDRALQGDVTDISGAVYIDRAPGVDRITINSSQAIITWNPETSGTPLPAGPIDFLPQGSVANFQNGEPGTTFTVLNRILPSDSTRAISLNGLVNTILNDGQGNGSQGGSVWFYSPGGIIVGPTAQFNVGNLVLTANDIEATEEGLTDPYGNIRFRGNEGGTSLIDVKPGALINSVGRGSYVALVAPRVAMGGTVQTTGSTAYVAAESVDININSGLFDIFFNSGTSAEGEVLSHTGTTTAASAEDYSGSGMFLAAMPKNQAITMLLGGQIGYAPAASAGIENGIVVLAAGANVYSGSVYQGEGSSPNAAITVGGVNATSSVVATATGGILIQPGAGQIAGFAGSADFSGSSIQLTAGGGAGLSFGSTLDLTAQDNVTIGGTDPFTLAVPGALNITAITGDIALSGPVTLRGNGSFALSAGGQVTGSQASIVAAADLVLTAPGGLSLANLDIGNQLLFGGGEASPFPADDFSQIVLSGRFKLGQGDLVLSGSTGLSFGQLAVVPGKSISLTSGGPINVGSIGTAALGKPQSITVDAQGAVTLTHAETSGNLVINGASFTTGLNSIIADGDIDITVEGLANLGNSQAGGHANVTADSIVFNSLTTLQDYISLGATSSIAGGTLTSAATTSATGGSGVDIATLVSAGAVDLQSTTGAISVGTQFDAPSVTANGQSVTLVSSKLVTAPSLTATAGAISVNAGSFIGNSASASGAVSITAPGGITLPSLTAGAASALSAANGAILVASNVSAPALSAIGGSVTLRSAQGSIAGLSGQATGGAFDARAAGSISGSTVSASTDAILIAPAGITLTGLSAGNDATLTASNGKIDVTGYGSGSLSAAARDIYLRGTGTFTAANLVSSVGNIDVQSANNLIVNSADAKAALTLGSTSGSLGFTTLKAGTSAALTAATTITGGSLTSSSAAIGGLDGVTLTGLSTSGTATLLATNGLIDASGVSANDVTATARGVTLQAPMVLAASQLTATAGNLDVRGAQLSLGTISATGTLFGQALQSGIDFTAAQAGDNATLIAATNVTGTTLASGGTISVTGPASVAIATATSSGTGNYSAANGGIDITNVAGSGVAATGRSVRLRAAGPLAVTNAQATAGNVDIQASGALAIGSANASAQLIASSSNGSVSFGTLTAGGATTLAASGALTGTTVNSGGNATITGTAGLDIGNLLLGASSAANLNAADGAIRITNNLTAASVQAQGRSVFLRSTGALNASLLRATAGDIDVQSDAMNANAVQASGQVKLVTANNALVFTTLTAGGNAILNAGSTLSGNSLTAANTVLTAPGTINVSTIATGAADLTSLTGNIIVGNDLRATSGTISGRSVTLRSLDAFALTGVQATAGAADLLAAGNITVGNLAASGGLVSSGGALNFASANSGSFATLNANTTINGGTLTVATNATLNAPSGITLTGLDVGGASQLTATNGLVDVSGLVGSNVGVNASAIRLSGSGAYGAGTLIAAGGLLDLNFGGDVTLGNASAATTLTVTSGGVLRFDSLTSGADATLTALSVKGGRLAASYATVTATNSISLTGLTTSGLASVDANSGSVEIADLNVAGISGAARSISLTSSGTLTASSLSATAGDLILAGAVLSLGNLSATSAISGTANAGGIGFTSLASGGNTALVSGTTVAGTTVTAGAAISITAPGGIDIANLRAAGAAALGASSGAVRVANDLAASALTASGRSLFLRSLGGFNAPSLTATAGPVDLGLAGALTFGTINSSGAVTINAGTTVGGATLASGGATAVNAPAGMTIGVLRSSGATTLTAASGAVRVNDEIAGSDIVADGQSIFLRNPGTLSLAQVRSTAGDVDIVTGGSLSIAAATAANALSLGSTGGNLSVGAIGGGQSSPANVTLAAAGSVTLGEAAARGTLSLTAGTVANFNGAIVAPTVAIRSADIAIAGGARIGAVGTTTQLTLTSTAGATSVGGSTAGSGYRLSEAEAQRLSANNILIATQPVGQGDRAIDPNATPSLLLDTLSLGAAQGQQGLANLASTGTLRFQTQGTMRVVGPVRLTGAGSGSQVELAAGPAIQVRPGGAVSLLNGTDPAGTLLLSATDIIASDAATLSGLASAPDAKAQSDLLGTNAGSTDDTGFFAANAITATVGNGFFVQNTGLTQSANSPAYGQRRGLTVGAGGLTITPSGQNAITVAVNGRQVSSSAAGGFVTGLDFAPLVKVGGNNAALVTAGSTINGCSIANPSACSITFDPGVIGRDLIEDGGELAEALAAATNAINVPDVLVELPGFNALVGQPLIEDPVTGSGNDDLLADKDGKQCDPSAETCTKD